jgi:hypothetical protein
MTGLFDGFEGYRVTARADVERALTEALVAVDANVLLNLYRYNAQTTQDLLTVLDRLGDRLVVPHQAMAEFHRNRLAAIGNPEQASKDVREALRKNATATNGALTTWAKHIALSDAELTRLLGDVEKVFGKLTSAVDEAEPDRVQATTPTDDDPVLRRLAEILDGRVLDRPSDDEWARLTKEGARRVAAKIPPGYRDADKVEVVAEGASGDYLVFQQSCAEAERRGLDLIIVTGDEKEDWRRAGRTSLPCSSK